MAPPWNGDPVSSTSSPSAGIGKRARLWMNRLMFQCPGCKVRHLIPVRADPTGGPVWEWNGSLDSPTLKPSCLVHETPASGEYAGQPRCHSFVTDGRIQFLADCSHELAGQTVDLPELET